MKLGKESRNEVHDSIFIDFGNACKASASILGDYQNISLEELLDHYLDEKAKGNRYKAEPYISAVILRFWYTIKNSYNAAKEVLGPMYAAEDFITFIYGQIEYACKYCAWKDKNKNLNAKQCINQSISSGLSNLIKSANKHCREANKFTVSLDKKNVGESSGEEGTSESENNLYLKEFSDDEYSSERFESDAVVRDYVQTFINRNLIVDAVVLDIISFNDCMNRTFVNEHKKTSTGEIKKYKVPYCYFSKQTAFDYLRSIAPDYEDYFKRTYSVDEESLKESLKKIKDFKQKDLTYTLTHTLRCAESILLKR